MSTLHANRRAVIGALATLPAICAIPSHATAAALDTAAWDMAMARYLSIKAESEHFDAVTLDPVYRRMEAIRPAYQVINTAKDGSQCRFSMSPSDFERYDLGVDGIDLHLFMRPEIDAMKAQHARYVKLGEELDYDAICDRSDRYGEQWAEAMSDLMDIPAPHGAAVLWKLENAFGEDACGNQGSIPCYDVGYLEVFFDDIRRLAGRI